MNAFTPGATVSLAVTAASGRVQVGLPNGRQIRLHNPAASAMMFFKFGTATVEAAVTDTPLPPGNTEMFTAPVNATHIAAITASGVATLYATSGQGA